jgi:hypothetical protein
VRRMGSGPLDQIVGFSIIASPNRRLLCCGS